MQADSSAFPPAARHALIDALRGFALFGIVLVNIQGFSWGIGAPSLGMLWDDAGTLDEVTLTLTSLLLVHKFYPIFCFCFGYGFAVMAKRWRRAGLDTTGMAARYQRRLQFLLAIGLLHGSVIWFGDILAGYALAGFLLTIHLGLGPRSLLKPLRFWGAVLLVLGLINVFTTLTITPRPVTDAEVGAMLDRFMIYSSGGYLDTITSRLGDVAQLLVAWLFVFPHVVFIFLLGALVAQLGWLQAPERHIQTWRRIFFCSLALGLPFSIGMAAHSVESASDPTLLPNTWTVICLMFAPLLAPAYIAALALGSLTPLGGKLVTLLAPMGRMALTNYLMQSVLMSLLLNGYGFGLADRGQFVIALLAIGIFVAQLIFSHVYLRYRAQGPMEAWWRRHTYNDKVQ